MRRDDLLDLNDILQHPGRELSVEVSTELADEEDIDLVAPLEGELDAVSTGNLLLITGRFKTRAVVECARCAAPLEVDIEFDIDEQFQVVGVPSGLSHEGFAKVEADEPYPLFEGNNLMVESLLRQNLILNYPVQPLCTAGWDGECPVDEEQKKKSQKPQAIRPEFEQLMGLVNEEEA